MVFISLDSGSFISIGLHLNRFPPWHMIECVSADVPSGYVRTLGKYDRKGLILMNFVHDAFKALSALCLLLLWLRFMSAMVGRRIKRGASESIKNESSSNVQFAKCLKIFFWNNFIRDIPAFASNFSISSVCFHCFLNIASLLVTQFSFYSRLFEVINHISEDNQISLLAKVLVPMRVQCHLYIVCSDSVQYQFNLEEFFFLFFEVLAVPLEMCNQKLTA